MTAVAPSRAPTHESKVRPSQRMGRTPWGSFGLGWRVRTETSQPAAERAGMRRRPRNPVPPAITTRGRVSVRCAVFMGKGMGLSVAAETEEGEDLVAEFHGFLEAGGGHAAHFIEP